MNDPAKRMKQEQLRLAPSVEIAPNPELAAKDARRVLALDVQYAGDVGHVAGSLWEGERELATFVGEAPVEVPYAPGYFCFREGPLLLALVDRLRAAGEAFDLLVVDGHGLAHPRRFGAACWLGVSSGLPTLGCAKESLLPAPTVGNLRGSHRAVWLEGDEVGDVLRTQDGINPVFVSPGHRIDREGAREAVLALPGEHRLPDPLRHADHAARMRARGERGDVDAEDLGRLV